MVVAFLAAIRWAGGRGVVPRGRHREPARVADPVGPLRDAAPAARRVPAVGRPLVGARRSRSSTAWPLVGITPPAVYPIVFWVTLIATLFVGRAAGGRERDARADRHPRHPDDRMTEPGPAGHRPTSSSASRSSAFGRAVLAGEPRRSTRSAATCSTSPTPSSTAGRRSTVRLGPNDVIPVGGPLSTCPFAPFPAIALMPIVALVGPVTRRPAGVGDQRRPRGASASACAGGCSAGSGSRGSPTGLWLTALFGFSTQILWVTTRGGVWHTGHLVATILTFACLIELFGRAAGVARRPVGRGRVPEPRAARLRGPVLRAPAPSDRRRAVATGSRRGGRLRRAGRVAIRVAAVGVAGARRGCPSIVVFFALQPGALRDAVRERATRSPRCPPFLEAQRAIGLFSLAHVPMNLDYFLFHLPRPIAEPAVLPARRPRDVRPHHEPGAPVRDSGRLASAADLVAARRRRSRS